MNTAAQVVATTSRARAPPMTCSGARNAAKKRIGTRPSSRTSNVRRGGCICGCRCWLVLASGYCGWSSAWPRYSSFPLLSSWPSCSIRCCTRWVSSGGQIHARSSSRERGYTCGGGAPESVSNRSRMVRSTRPLANRKGADAPDDIVAASWHWPSVSDLGNYHGAT